jgi:hypothetical protein
MILTWQLLAACVCIASIIYIAACMVAPQREEYE